MLDQLDRCLFTYSGNPRDIVDTVAHHAEDVNDLLGLFNAELFLYLFDSNDFCGFALPAWLVHEYILVNQLCIVLVRGHHVYREAFIRGDL